MSYLCRKAVQLKGKKYASGDMIPDGAILSQRVRKLVSMGYISAVSGKADGGSGKKPPEAPEAMLKDEIYTSDNKIAPEGRGRARKTSRKTDEK